MRHFTHARGSLGSFSVMVFAATALSSTTAWALDEGAKPTTEDVLFVVHNVWMLMSTMLVFIMHLGFGLLEAGLTRAKNTVNILTKNTLIVAIGVLSYAAVGFSLMYPGADFAGDVIGFAGFGLHLPDGGLTNAYNPAYTYWTDFLFQGMFAATAATIISGAIAERTKLFPFLVLSLVYVAVIYPVVGFWHWGGGWLAARGFHDFAGSTIVHSVGGWGALAGILVVGARKGKFVGRQVKPILGHSMPLVFMGVFLLWFGWYGFNGGSVLSADPAVTSLVFVTTTLAAAAGVFVSFAVSTLMQKKPDVTMVLNGALAGLVSITAGADVVTPLASVVIGGLGGALVVFAVMAFDRLRLDDPVGATSVHLVCGVFGTLMVGVFAAEKSFVTQLVGVVATFALAFPSSYALFFVMKKTVGIRVDEEEEWKGLDLAEHGMEAYPGANK